MKTMLKMSIVAVLLICAGMLITSCSRLENIVPSYDRDDSGSPTPVLLSSTKISHISAVELQLLAAVSGYNIPSSIMKYDVDVYKVTYRTMYKGNEITASGIVSMPVTQDSVSMLSLHHGTIAAYNEAPSVQSSTQSMILYAAIASPGFITVVPDYIGFGSSTGILHPYFVEQYSASAVVDNLKAAGELANSTSNNFNSKLFLAGYSEGGYVTMAAHKSIEENGLDGFNLVASFPAAGGYDVIGMQKYLFSLTTYDQPYYIPYVALAYRNVYDWTRPLTDFLNEPYADLAPSLFDGTKSGSQINASLTTDLTALLNRDLVANIGTSATYAYIATALRENTLTDWAPKKQMYMYHGDADTTVPYQNSVDTYNQLIANGASTSSLRLITLTGANHDSGLQPYIEDVVPKLLQLTGAQTLTMARN